MPRDLYVPAIDHVQLLSTAAALCIIILVLIWSCLEGGLKTSQVLLAFSAVLTSMPHWLDIGSLVRFQDKLSDRRRRWIYGNNDNNPAVQLPQELLLHTFHLLNQRARHGSTQFKELCMYDRIYRGGYPDLLAAMRVCRAWQGPATEVLYEHVSVPIRACEEHLSRTLLHTPILVSRIRGLHMKGFSDGDRRGKLFSDAPLRGLETCFSKWSTRRPTQLTLAYDSLWDCTDTNSAVIEWDNTRFSGLSQCHSGITSLRIISQPWGEPGFVLRLPITVPQTAAIYGPKMRNLRSLWLSCLRLMPEGVPEHPPTYRSLDALRLTDCIVSREWLMWLFSGCEQGGIRVLEYSSFSHPFTSNSPGVPLDDLIGIDRCAALEEITFRLGMTMAERNMGSLGSLSRYAALKVLVIDMALLQGQVRRHGLTEIPPQLETLVVHLCYRPRSPDDRGAHLRPKRLLAEIEWLKAIVPLWAMLAKRLRTLQLWDEVQPRTWNIWRMIGVLATPWFAKEGVELDINLSLDEGMLDECREMFATRRILRRLKWQDVW